MTTDKFMDVEFGLKDEVFSYDQSMRRGKTKGGQLLGEDVAHLRLKHGDKIIYDLTKRTGERFIVINVVLIERAKEELLNENTTV